jgi:hypothetical protein
MWMDIRRPIGLFFSAVGALLVAYGLAGSSAIYAASLGININVEWGAVLLVFGLIMCFLGRRGRPGDSEGSSSASPPDHRGQR